MKKGIIIHYILFIAGAGLVIAAGFMLNKNSENMWSKLIVAFGGLFVMLAQYLIIRAKRK